MFVMEHEHGRLLGRVYVCVRAIIVCVFAFKKLRMRLFVRVWVCENSLHCHYRRTYTQICNAYIKLYILIKLTGKIYKAIYSYKTDWKKGLIAIFEPIL